MRGEIVSMRGERLEELKRAVGDELQAAGHRGSDNDWVRPG